MSDLSNLLTASEIEETSPDLLALKGVSFSHLALADALWSDKYGQISDPEVFRFSAKRKLDADLPQIVWKAFKHEWYAFACTDDERYKPLRTQIDSLRGRPATIIISTISAVIANLIRMEAAILVPFVAIFTFYRADRCERAVQRFADESKCRLIL